MSPTDREKFFAWYNDLVRKEHVFDFQVEILRYCQSDVDIVRRCCLEFRELFREISDVDQFAQCLTIASACDLVFRKTFLKENTIAVISPCGYKPENKQSVIALKMLAWIAQRDNIAIRHARNHGEQRTLLMATTLSSTLFGRTKDACGMDAPNVTPGALSTT